MNKLRRLLYTENKTEQNKTKQNLPTCGASSPGKNLILYFTLLLTLSKLGNPGLDPSQKVIDETYSDVDII
jgi:hypothetical protein